MKKDKKIPVGIRLRPSTINLLKAAKVKSSIPWNKILEDGGRSNAEKILKKS